MLAWSFEALDASPEIDRLVAVVAPTDRPACAGLVASLHLHKRLALIEGGDTRHDSEFNGIAALAPEILDGSVARILVHDAARPFLDLALVTRLLEALSQNAGAVPALPAQPTLVSGLTGGQLQDFVRDAWAVQTPQAFRAQPLLDAHRRARADGYQGSDTASVLERSGQSVALLEGSPDAFKVTTPVDLLRAQIVAKRLLRSSPQQAPSPLAGEG